MQLVGHPRQEGEGVGHGGAAGASRLAHGRRAQVGVGAEGAREAGEAAGGRIRTLRGAVTWEQRAAVRRRRSRAGAGPPARERCIERVARDARASSSVRALAVMAVRERDLPQRELAIEQPSEIRTPWREMKERKRLEEEEDWEHFGLKLFRNTTNERVSSGVFERIIKL